jgi:hypothetical protein
MFPLRIIKKDVLGNAALAFILQSHINAYLILIADTDSWAKSADKTNVVHLSLRQRIQCS